MQRLGRSQRNAQRVVQMSASTYLHKFVVRDVTLLKMRIKKITDTRVHYGNRRVQVLPRREGHTGNVKRVCRLHREQGPSLWLKRSRRNKAAKWRQPNQICCGIHRRL